MKYGDKLEIRLTNSTGHWFYSEPFPITAYGTDRNFREALRVFEENAGDAVKGMLRDIETDRKVKDLDSDILASALRNRGYTVTKNTAP